MEAFDRVTRVADRLVFHRGEDDPCTALSAKEATAFALALLEGAHDINTVAFEDSDWPGIVSNTKPAEPE